MGDKRVACSCPWNAVEWQIMWQVATFIMVVFTVIVVAIGAAINADPDAVQRYYVRATGSESANALLEGYFVTDSSANTVSFDFFYTGNVSAIQSIIVRGPRAAGQLTGPIKFALCGYPSLVNVCNIFSVPGQVSAGPFMSLQPGPLAAHKQIEDIRKAPFQYYIEVWTANNPAEPGGLRGDLGAVGGVE